MRMPINHTTITPSVQLSLALGRLAQIAAAAHVLGVSNLENQATEAYNNLVAEYNNQLPSDKPKGFWAKFKDNLTFRDLDTTVALRLPLLHASNDFDLYKDIYAKMNHSELTNMLNKLLSNQL